MSGPRLPVGPMAAWINGQADTSLVLARRAGIPVTTINELRQQANATVDLDIADRLLCSNRVNLDEVWPDLDVLLGLEVVA